MEKVSGLSDSTLAKPLNGLSWTSYAIIVAAGIVSFLWLIVRLDARYLWQDEAMTAVPRRSNISLRQAVGI